MEQQGSERWSSVPPRTRRSSALSSFWIAALWLVATSPASEARELTLWTSEDQFTEAALADGCEPGDFGEEGFEGLVGVEIEESPTNFAIGIPEVGFQFPSGIVLGGPDPSFDLTVVDLDRDAEVTYFLGDNIGITNESILPSGSGFAAPLASGRVPICFFLPPSASECNAVGMYLSSYDGAIEGREVTLALFDEDGRTIGTISFPTEPINPELDGFIGVTGAGRTIRSITISRDEVFVLDDLWHPKWDNEPYSPANTELCPEPSETALAFTAIAALATLSARRRRAFHRSLLSQQLL